MKSKQYCMKKFALQLISFYQKWISPLKKPSCVFYPTCSEYSKDAIKKYGVGKGFIMSIRRILRCHPWQKDRIDLVK